MRLCVPESSETHLAPKKNLVSERTTSQWRHGRPTLVPTIVGTNSERDQVNICLITIESQILANRVLDESIVLGVGVLGHGRVCGEERRCM